MRVSVLSTGSGPMRRPSSSPALFACGLLCALAAAPMSGARATDFDRTLPVVRRIEILGNRSLDDGVLKSRMRTKSARFYHLFGGPRYRPDMLRRDVRTLESFYRSNGFFEARVSIDTVIVDAKRSSARIRIGVSEGPQTLVAGVSFAGQDVVREPELRAGLKLTEGRPYNPGLIESDRYMLFSKFFEHGYLGSTIAYETRIDSLKARLRWEISPGKPVGIRRVRIIGNARVKESLVRRELTFKTGQPFEAKRILDSKQNLYDTGYFNSVEIEPDSIDLDARKVDLVVRVRERKMGYIETGFGIGNVYGSRVFGEWGQRNILGRGYVFSLKTQYSFQLFPNGDYSLSNIDLRNKYIRNDGQIQFPRVFSTGNTFAIGAFYERDATVEPNIVVDQGFALSLSRRFTRKTSGLLRYSLEDIERSGTDIEFSRSRRRALGANFTHDARDYYFNPRRGGYFAVEGGVAGGFLGGEDNDYSIVGSVQRYTRAGGSAVFAWRVRAGYARAFGDSRAVGLPLERRFYAGGGNSVRGYRENSLGPVNERGDPVGGGVQIITNAELRFDLPYLKRWNFGGALFLDGGNVWSEAADVAFGDFGTIGTSHASRDEYMLSAGAGIRYNTPVGPIRLDVGFPIRRTPDMDYDRRVHISLGQIF